MLSLLDLCLDAVILTTDRKLLKDMWKLHPLILKMLDQRYIKMQYSKKYKKHFNNSLLK